MSVGNLVAGMLVGALAGSFMNRGGGGGGGSSFSSAVPMVGQQPVPTVPKAPEDVTSGEENAAALAVKEAEEKEKQAALARQKAGQDVFTSPLGAAGQAALNRKQLLGA